MNKHTSIFRVGPAIKKIFEVVVEPKNEDFHEFTKELYDIAKKQGVKSNEKLFIWVPNNIKIEGEPVMVVSEKEKENLFKAAVIIESYCEKSEIKLTSYKEKLKFASEYIPSIFCNKIEITTK